MALNSDVRDCRSPMVNRQSKILPCLRPGMMFLIYVLQPIQCQMRVHLGRRNISMAEDALHGAKIGTVLHHVGGATVTQHVRTGVASRIPRGRTHHLPNTLSSQLPRTAPQEEKGRTLACCQLSASISHIFDQSILC